MTVSAAEHPGQVKYKPNQQLRLPQQVNNPHLWPTPDASPRGATPNFTGTRPSGHKESLNLQTAVKMYPTPTATMHKGSSPAALTRKNGRDRSNDRLDHAIQAQEGSGQLNPQWVEWLMGYPEGWTDLKD